MRELVKRQVLPNLLLYIAESTGGVSVVHERGRPVTYMIREENIFQTLREVGTFLVELTKIPKTIISPESPEELNSLVAQIFEVKTKGVSIPFYTPICPDWSRDSRGRYDFRGLGDGASFIAEKFFQEAPPLLGLFARFGIPYEGHLLSADFGLEMDITTKDSYGMKMSQEEIESCFASTIRETQEKLEAIKGNQKKRRFFEPYEIVRMTTFFRNRGFNPETVGGEMRKLFKNEAKGKRLIERLHLDSFKFNRERLGFKTEEENREYVTQNLVEYATLGQSFGERGVIIACESRTSSKAYNLFRETKLPIFYVKGEKEGGENIL